MKYYESLQNYFKNGCKLHPEKKPVWGEIGYEEYIKKQIAGMKIKSGDKIRVEQKWSSGTVESYEGTVLQISKHRFWILSKGKTVWKDKSNRKDIIIKYITKIEKIKEAGAEFDIYSADPDYKYVREHQGIDKCKDDIENKRTSKFQEQLKTKFPGNSKKIILWLSFDFYWDYSNGVVKEAEINIINKNGQVISVPKYKNRHVYPNHFYYTCCGVKNTDVNHNGILLFFDSFDELQNIHLISCTWTVILDNNKDINQLQFLQMIYPTFIEGDTTVYNIHCRCTDLGTYEEALHKYSVFSGMLEKEYNKAFVHIANREKESYMNIMNAEDIEDIIKEHSLDLTICLNNNSFEKMFNNLHATQQTIAEIFIKYANVKPRGYTWPY